MLHKVCHLTSAHTRYDTRIFVKECCSLSKEGFDVSLIVADGLEEEIKEGVRIISVTKSNGRISRMWHNVNNIYKQAIIENADLYHFHDPELLRIALKLKKKGKKVIFDSHEDVPRQILGKFWIPKLVRSFASWSFEKYQNKICRNIDGVIAATPFIKNIFLDVNLNTIDVCNYPILKEFPRGISQKRRDKIVYIGGVSDIRGGEVMVNAIGNIRDEKLTIAGDFIPQSYKEELETLEGWKNINFVGFLNRKEIAKLLSESYVGLVVLKPLINYLDSLPIKMFEYMAAGVPVIASDFPLWKSIVEKEKCGLSVDPLDARDLAHQISLLKKNPKLVFEMGNNGRKAIENKYNWELESRKLISFYFDILKT